MKKGKELMSLFLVLSLVALYGNLLAKERRGAKLIITKKDGQQVQGELITVKPNSLILLDTEGKDVSVGIADIKVIKIVKKLGVVKGALVGLLASGYVTAIKPLTVGLVMKAGVGEILSVWLPDWGKVAPFGAIVGAILGALLKVRKKIKIEGMSDSEIQKTIDKLRKKARIRDYK